MRGVLIMKKMTITAKEMKSVIEKVATAIDKKSAYIPFLYINFISDADGVKVIAGHSEQALEITLNECTGDIDSFAIDFSDIKAITKLSGTLTLSYDSEKSVLNVTCGKKSLSLKGYEVTDFNHLNNDSEKDMFTANTNWFIDTLNNLVMFTSPEKARPSLQCVNFNSAEKQVEACDGFRAVTRKMNIIDIKNTDSVLIPQIAVHILKKSIGKNTDNTITVMQGNKSVIVKGVDFKYTVKKVNGNFLNINALFANKTAENSAMIDKKEFISVLKYANDIADTEKHRLIMHANSNTLYSFITTGKIESMDEITATNVNINNNLYIGYNARYLLEIFSILDVDAVEYNPTGDKSITFFSGNEYNALVLPVLLQGSYNSESNDLKAFKSKF
jgi:DNA polymerase III sliding clamp (beta) subunit (PCNA family)